MKHLIRSLLFVVPHSDTRCLFTPTLIYCNWIVLLGTLQVILCYLLTSHCRYNSSRKPQTATRLRPPRLKEHYVDFQTQNCINFFVLRGKLVPRTLRLRRWQGPPQTKSNSVNLCCPLKPTCLSSLLSLENK